MKREFRAVGIGPYTAHLASEKLDDDEVELAAVVVRLRGQEQVFYLDEWSITFGGVDVVEAIEAGSRNPLRRPGGE